MKVVCLTIGKKHDPKLLSAIEEYEGRLRQWCEFSWHVIPSSDIENESSKTLSFLKDEDHVILLDEDGVQKTNKELAKYIHDHQNQSLKRLVIIIGGAFGSHPNVAKRANLTLSFSKLVFPHQLVRLILVEQLYRSFSIIHNSNYHH